MFWPVTANSWECGQTLLLFVLALGVLFGFVALAIDVGLLYEDRRHLQNTADAAALAGVAELPTNPALATAKAAEWAANNGVDSSRGQVYRSAHERDFPTTRFSSRWKEISTGSSAASSA